MVNKCKKQQNWKFIRKIRETTIFTQYLGLSQPNLKFIDVTISCSTLMDLYINSSLLLPFQTR